MKLKEFIKHETKLFVYERLCRLSLPVDDYDRTTRSIMADMVLESYQDPTDVIEMCTYRELEVLAYFLDGRYEKDLRRNEKKAKQDLISLIYQPYPPFIREHLNEINWLQEKYLLINDPDHVLKLSVPEELQDTIRQAIRQCDRENKLKFDTLFALTAGYIRAQGSILLDALTGIISQITGLKQKTIENILTESRIARFFVTFDKVYVSGADRRRACYYDYQDLLFDLDERRKMYGAAAGMEFIPESFIQIFYTGMNINAPEVKALYNALCNEPWGFRRTMEKIEECRLLYLQPEDEPHFRFSQFDNHESDILKNALQYMPSGALNGLTPIEYSRYLEQADAFQKRVRKEYHPQKNACLNQTESSLFFYLYLSLLQYVNLTFRIYPGHDPALLPFTDVQLQKISEKLWQDPQRLIRDYCKKNPDRMDKDQLNTIRGFLRGKPGIYHIVRFNSQYTAFSDEKRVYMVKGLTQNIDAVIPDEELPVTLSTVLLPFRGKIVYDGIPGVVPARLSLEVRQQIYDSYDQLEKIYKL